VATGPFEDRERAVVDRESAAGAAKGGALARGGAMRNVVIVMVALLIVLTLVAGCSRPINVPLLAEADVPRLDAAANFPHRTYRIEAGDTVQLKYEFHAERNQELVVQPDGKIAVMQVGEVVAAGLTPPELEKVLREKTSRSLRNPEIVVAVTKFGEKTVFVGGEVGKPGPVTYRRGLTPLQAIIAVGGFKEGARLDSVILVRAGNGADEYISRRLDLEQVVADGAREALYLAPHDIVYVPRTAIADAGLWVKQHITDIIPLFRGATMPLPLF
jgi:polysaccharide export outer membrane protein